MRMLVTWIERLQGSTITDFPEDVGWILRCSALNIGGAICTSHDPAVFSAMTHFERCQHQLVRLAHQLGLTAHGRHHAMHAVAVCCSIACSFLHGVLYQNLTC
jgi:hypothetical protein